MNTSKIYDTELEGLQIRIKGKSICFVIDGKPHWSTLSDRIYKKLNDLINIQNAEEKKDQEFWKLSWNQANDGCPGQGLSGHTNYDDSGK